MPSEARIAERGVLFRLTRSYREGMSPFELYEATRGTWRIKRRDLADDVEYAFAVYRCIVKEVYKVHQWYPAGTTPYKTRDVGVVDRWEFEGEVATEEIRRKYVGKTVDHWGPDPVKFTWS